MCVCVHLLLGRVLACFVSHSSMIASQLSLNGCARTHQHTRKITRMHKQQCAHVANSHPSFTPRAQPGPGCFDCHRCNGSQALGYRVTSVITVLDQNRHVDFGRDGSGVDICTSCRCNRRGRLSLSFCSELQLSGVSNECVCSIWNKSRTPVDQKVCTRRVEHDCVTVMILFFTLFLTPS